MKEEKDKEFAISGKQKGSVRAESNAVSGTRVTNVLKNQNSQTAPPSEPPTPRGRSASRK